MQPLQICIGSTIRIGRESWCLPYAGFFENVLSQIIFLSMLIEEYQIIFSTFLHLKNQRRPVLSMGMKDQGCPI